MLRAVTLAIAKVCLASAQFAGAGSHAAGAKNPHGELSTARSVSPLSTTSGLIMYIYIYIYTWVCLKNRGILSGWLCSLEGHQKGNHSSFWGPGSKSISFQSLLHFSWHVFSF